MSGSWGWLGQYAIAIVLALALGTILGRVPLFTHTFIGSIGLRTSHIAWYTGYGGALIMLWLLSHRASREIREDGEGLTFLRAILRPMAAVVLVFFGYKLLLSFNSTIFGNTVRPVYHWLYVLGILTAAAWLTFSWLRHAGALIKCIEGWQRSGETGDSSRPVPDLAERTWVGTAGFRTGPDGTVVMSTRKDRRKVKPSLGRYELIKELGRGSMGVVYLGKDPTINRPVAVKTMRLDQVDDPDELKDFKERFFLEAESTGRLSHPNIVTIYDAGEEGELGYIAMELLEGKALKLWCGKEKLLPLKHVMEIMATVAGALDYAHGQGVVHRDIKPANIMVGKYGMIKVMDFGIARIMTSVKTQTRVILGTPSYMSPEQLDGAPVDGRSDVFSLGVVLFELVTGEKPFEAESISSLLFKIAHEPHPSPRTIRPDLPAWCQTILDRALQKDPADRHQTAGELAHDLSACLSGLPV